MDILAVSYPQCAVRIEPTTEQHVVQQEEVRCSPSAPNLQQNEVMYELTKSHRQFCIVTLLFYDIINVITIQ